MKFKELFINETFKDVEKTMKLISEMGITYTGIKNNGNNYGSEVSFELDLNRDDLVLAFNNDKAYISAKNNNFRRLEDNTKEILKNATERITTEEGLKLIKKYFKTPEKIFDDMVSSTGKPLSDNLLGLLMKKYSKRSFTKLSKDLFKLNSAVEIIAMLLEKIDFNVDGKYLDSSLLDMRVGVSQGDQALRIDDNSNSRDIINVVGTKLNLYEIQAGNTSFKMSDKELEQVANLLSKKLVIKYGEFLNYKIPDDWSNPLTNNSSTYSRKSGKDYSGHQFSNSIGGDSSNYR